MIDPSSITLFLCASLGPGAFCHVLQRHILHSSCVRIFLRSCGFSIPSHRGYDFRDRLPWFFASLCVTRHDIAVRMISLPCLMRLLRLSPRVAWISIAVAVLSLPPRVRVEIFASCAHRESSVHHCLLLKAVSPVSLCGSLPLLERLLRHLQPTT